jgi:hypothetical protein
MWPWIVGVIVVVAIAIFGIAVTRRRRLPTGVKGDVLPAGWQFFDKPSTLEGPGTIFRIDQERRRFRVTELDVTPEIGPEAFGRQQHEVAADSGIVASFLGIAKADVGAKTIERIVIELQDCRREVLDDMQLDELLNAAAVFKKIQIREGNDYYIIRETRVAASVTYHLTREHVISLGGQAGLAEIEAEGNVVRSTDRDEIRIEQRLDPPMGVLYLAEQFSVSRKKSLTGDGIGVRRVPVSEPLRYVPGDNPDGDF